MVALADFVGSVTDVAITTIVPPDGTLDGASYAVGSPLDVLVGETVPHAAPLQAVPFAPATVQVTPLFDASFVTVAVNSCGPVTNRRAVVGRIETETLWARAVNPKTDKRNTNSTAFSARIFLLLL
jgi:hypothetical protein